MMYKKLIAFLLVFSQINCGFDSYKMGRDLTKGAIDEVGTRLSSPELAQGTQQLITNLIDSGFKAAGESFKHGGESDKAASAFGQASGRGMSLASSGVAQGIEDSSEILSGSTGKAFSNIMSELGNQFEKGSEFDLAQKQVLGTVGTNINDFIQQVGFNNMIKYGAISLAITGGYYAIPVIAKYVERELLNPRPKLIIESSKKSLTERFTSMFYAAPTPAEMVFSPSLKQQLDDIIKVTSVIQKKIYEGKTNVKYRNLMLYGPPGTGKTMFAKELAKQSGLEYAFMSGSSFSKFKDGEGIEALDELFAWAKRSKGLMIFIDEAETFLSKRENMDPQSKAYQLLNNFLNYTGERSSQFMLVFATNHKDALDSAMYRRIDDLIEMPLPSKMQRLNTLILYKKKILLDVLQNGKQFVDSVNKQLNDDIMKSIAERTKGLSYGDLEGIVNTIKTDTDILEPAIVSQKLINTVVDRAVKKHEAFTNGKLLGTVED
jgi:ATPase family associated with various cellular activities (AAA)